MLPIKWIKSLLMISLITGVSGGFVTAVGAQDQFDQNQISFRQDTIVEFEFISSNGSNQSTFGIVNLTTGAETVLFQEVKPYDNYDGIPRNPRQRRNLNPLYHLGTIGNAVMPGPDVTVRAYPSKPNGSVVEFLFKRDQVYAFFLQSTNYLGTTRRTLLSTENYVQFDGNLAGGTMIDRNGRTIVGRSMAWEDGGEKNRSDLDFDDFLVEAGGVLRDGCHYCQSNYISHSYSYYQIYPYQPYHYPSYQFDTYPYRPYQYQYFPPYYYYIPHQPPYPYQSTWIN